MVAEVKEVELSVSKEAFNEILCGKAIVIKDFNKGIVFPKNPASAFAKAMGVNSCLRYGNKVFYDADLNLLVCTNGKAIHALHNASAYCNVDRTGAYELDKNGEYVIGSGKFRYKDNNDHAMFNNILNFMGRETAEDTGIVFNRANTGIIKMGAFVNSQVCRIANDFCTCAIDLAKQEICQTVQYSDNAIYSDNKDVVRVNAQVLEDAVSFCGVGSKLLAYANDNTMLKIANGDREAIVALIYE